MARSIIFTVDPSGTLTAMKPSEPRNEDFMQQLVALHPELIADQDGELLLIRREQPIADGEDAGGRWSLDHLFVTRTGIPVLVEIKRAVDTRLRREVIGQMLDYAANGTVYWKAGRVAESFAESMSAQQRDGDEVLATFLDGSMDPQDFWQQVDANFSAGRIKLVFVADTIPRELARIVEFLNEQMRADVRAVELSWFESDSGVTALTPRVIGETERAQTAKSVRASLPAVDRDTWIEARLAAFGEGIVQASQAFIALVDEAGGRTEVTNARGSITAIFDTLRGPLYPLRLTPERKGLVQLSMLYLLPRQAFAGVDVRQRLYDKLKLIVGSLTTDNLKGFPGFDARMLNDPNVRREISVFIAELRDTALEVGINPETEA
jgi:hypothetical protein